MKLVAALKEMLALRYGLLMSPAPDQIAQWSWQVQVHLRTGLTFEKAGELAARQVFPGYGLAPPDRSIGLQTLLPFEVLQKRFPITAHESVPL